MRCLLFSNFGGCVLCGVHWRNSMRKIMLSYDFKNVNGGVRILTFEFLVMTGRLTP